jgi:hypothetical protein
VNTRLLWDFWFDTVWADPDDYYAWQVNLMAERAPA